MEKKEKRGRKAVPTVSEKVNKYTEGGTKEYNYLYSIPSINQKVIVEQGWDIDFLDIIIFLDIKSIIHYTQDKKSKGLPIDTWVTNDNNGDWYFICESKIAKDLPMLPIASGSPIYKRVKKLCECGLIERNPSNEKTRQKLIRLGKNAYMFERATFKEK
ncbi:MAG: hypothetical protein ACOC2U_00790 [bacterium]